MAPYSYARVVPTLLALVAFLPGCRTPPQAQPHKELGYTGILIPTFAGAFVVDARRGKFWGVDSHLSVVLEHESRQCCWAVEFTSEVASAGSCPAFGGNHIKLAKPAGFDERFENAPCGLVVLDGARENVLSPGGRLLANSMADIKFGKQVSCPPLGRSVLPSNVTGGVPNEEGLPDEWYQSGHPPEIFARLSTDGQSGLDAVVPFETLTVPKCAR